MHRTDHERSTVAVAIFSSNDLLRLGLQHIVENERWIHLIGHAATVTALDDLLTREPLHVIIIDSEVAYDVTALIQKIKTVNSRIRILLLSGLLEECARQANDCAVDGIVLKVQPSVVLIATIDHLTQPVEVTPPRFGTGIAQLNRPKPPNTLVRPAGKTPETKWPAGLTERECDVIRCISQGLSNKYIADRLCISSITVRHHLTNIFDKLGVSNRQQLLIHTHQCGIAELTANASESGPWSGTGRPR